MGFWEEEKYMNNWSGVSKLTTYLLRTLMHIKQLNFLHIENNWAWINAIIYLHYMIHNIIWGMVYWDGFCFNITTFQNFDVHWMVHKLSSRVSRKHLQNWEVSCVHYVSHQHHKIGHHVQFVKVPGPQFCLLQFDFHNPRMFAFKAPMNSLLLIQSLFINCKHVLFKFILFSASVHNHLDDTYTTILKNWYKWDFFELIHLMFWKNYIVQ